MTERKTDTIALRKYMAEKQMNVTDLSKASGVSRACLGSVLNGKSQPSAEVMTKLVDALEIPPNIAGAIFFSHNLCIA